MAAVTTVSDIPMRQVSHHLFAAHGRQVDPGTPYAWAKFGVNGRKLAVFERHGKQYTTAAELDAFLAHADAYKAARGKVAK